MMDWSVYDLVDIFKMHDAAYLLCGHEPLIPVRERPENDPHEIIRSRASVLIDQLINDARVGKLKVVDRDGEDPLSRSDRKHLQGGLGSRAFMNYPEIQFFITRHNLKNWAAKKGLEPPFLFPEARINNNAIKERKESTVLTENLYRTIICLAMDSYKYNPNASKSDVPAQLSKMMLTKYGVEISSKSIKRWLHEGINLVPQVPQKY